MQRDETIDSGSGGLTATQAQHVRRTGLREMVRRSRALTVTYPILIVVVLLTTPYGEIAPLAIYAMLAASSALAVARGVLALRFDRAHAARPRLAHVLFGAGAVLAGALWGSFGAYTMVAFAFEWTTFLVLLCASALMAGCLTSLGIGFRWFLLHVLCGLGPLVVMGVVIGGETGLALAGIFLCYAGFLALQARAVSREYWTSSSRAAIVERAKRAAEEASLAKSEFLANMSHEIRTPL
ncbi:MAG: hypothetical protein P1V36_00955, partial [Planctomycetota bacterium]|nr:hypothetical protein [Planctomycetota bacterium]